MAYIVNLYRDAQCKDSALSVVIGQAGITGYYATKSNWIRMDLGNYQCYRAQLSNTDGRNGVILSGATPIFDFQDLGQRLIFTDPANHALLTDKKRHNDNTPQYNTFFCGIDGQSGNRLRSWTIQFSGSESPNWFDFSIKLQKYLQEPLDAVGNSRTMWTYDDLVSYPQVSAQLVGQLQQSICFYKLNVWDVNYFCVALGVSRAGAPNASTVLLLIPEDVFKDKPIHPYIGPVSKESAESAYIGNPAGTDSISSRDLSSLKNPFGFNSGGTMYLSEISSSTYHSIVSGIYDGTSGSPLNALGQVVSGIVGGNTHRPAEEIDAMIKGVLCCHIVPTITTYTTGSPIAIYTISGYQIQNTALAGNAVNQICTAETAAFAVKRINGSFLDFEPYTTIDLVVPFLGTVRIPASVIMDKAVKIRFAIDLLSGTLSADIIISEVGRSWVYTTIQGNCALDMPIMGAGANANPLLKIASAAGGIATGGTLGAAAGVFNIIDGAASAAFSQPVGKCNLANIGAFLSPRDIALIIHTPSPSNAQDFGVIVGTPSNMSGKVGDFKGYTEFVDVDLDAVHGATDEEKAEIDRILKGGVFL